MITKRSEELRRAAENCEELRIARGKPTSKDEFLIGVSKAIHLELTQLGYIVTNPTFYGIKDANAIELRQMGIEFYGDEAFSTYLIKIGNAQTISRT